MIGFSSEDLHFTVFTDTVTIHSHTTRENRKIGTFLKEHLFNFSDELNRQRF